MDKMVKRAGPLHGQVQVSSDKSISHRAALFAALASGTSVVRNFLLAADTLSTCGCLRQLGVSIQQEGGLLQIHGHGWEQWQEPVQVLDCGNSGTTMRLLAGALAGHSFLSVLSGDHSLNRRPMKRVIEPLQKMGGNLVARKNQYAPLVVIGSSLQGIQYRQPVASAQVKSCILLAGLNARGETVIQEPEKSRDHTERMLAAMGADLQVNGLEITLKPGNILHPQEFLVPGDISSAAFFMVAATIVPGSELLIQDVGVNPTRAGIIQVLRDMGADINLERERIIGGEPVADILIKSAPLRGVHISGSIIPQLIDELPVLAVAMAAAEGTSSVADAGELRVKETDRISAICTELGKLGTDITETSDGFEVRGKPGGLQGNSVNTCGDHRIAMSLAIAGLAARGATVINGAEIVNISFPTFWDTLSALMGAQS